MNTIYRPFFAAGAMAAAVAAASPADATLQLAFDVNGIAFACVDNTACDTNPAVGVLDIANSVFAGVDVNGSIQVSTGTPGNPGLDILSTSSLSIINTNGVAVTGSAAISDTDFSWPVSSWQTSGSGTFVKAAGASTTFNWYIDPTNTQGANTSTDTPGALVATFTHAAGSPADSFSTDAIGPASLTSPFSMTEQFTLSLPPGAELLSRGQTIILAVPEPSTWAMGLLGFGFLGFTAYRRRNKRATPAFQS